MNYSAKALFSDWYNSTTKREAPVEELQNRRKIIDGFIKEGDINFWLGLLKIYLGISGQTTPEYIALVDKFKSNDDFFSVTNTNLLRMLAGCSVAEKIEENGSYISDMLALGICTRIGQQIEILPQLPPLAEQFWIGECERGRDMPTKAVPKKMTQFFSKVVMTAGADSPASTTVADETIKNLGLVQKDTNNLLVNANALMELISQLQINQKYLAEESNVLWWIFGGYSEILNKRLNTLTSKPLAIIVPFELSELTINLPGLGKIDHLVSKVFEMNGSEKEMDTLENFIVSIGLDAERLQEYLPEIDPSLNNLCPILNSIHCFTEFAGNEWKSVYEKKGGIPITTQFESSLISSQLYKELMLLKVVEELRS